jgi:hypothetical protein
VEKEKKKLPERKREKSQRESARERESFGGERERESPRPPPLTGGATNWGR